MTALSTFAAAVVLAVFLIAGGAKLLDRPGARRAFEGFGIPPAAAAPLSIALPLLELAIGLTLLPGSTMTWAVLAAFVLLVVLSLAVLVSLARGRRPDCHCFGQLSSGPVGAATLARNLLLAALAAALYLAGDTSAGLVAGIRALDLTAVLAGALVVLAGTGGWLLLQLLRQHGRLLMRIESLEKALRESGGAHQADESLPLGLPVGSPAPEFELPEVDGGSVTLSELLAPARPVMLVFVDPGCGPCTALLPELATWQHTHPESLAVAAISRGGIAENLAASEKHGLENVLVQADREVTEAYAAQATPSAVVIDRDGEVASPLALGAREIRQLADSHSRASRPTVLEMPAA